MSVRLTKRCMDLLELLRAARWLTTEQILKLEGLPERMVSNCATNALAMKLSLTRRAHDGPGLSLIPNRSMAWRPYANLIDGELDNRTPGKVTGWMCFYRRGKRPLRVTFDLAGDFHEDIRGKV